MFDFVSIPTCDHAHFFDDGVVLFGELASFKLLKPILLVNQRGIGLATLPINCEWPLMLEIYSIIMDSTMFERYTCVDNGYLGTPSIYLGPDESKLDEIATI